MQYSQIPDPLLVPFSSSGDKNAIPNQSTSQTLADGLAAFSSGFPPTTSLHPLAGGKFVQRQDVNGVLNRITLIQQWQQTGTPRKYESSFSQEIGGYPKGAILLNSGATGFWVSTADNNTTNPDSGGAGWISLQNMIGGFGIGQSWVNETSNRFLNVTYVNPYEYAIMCYITTSGYFTSSIEPYVDSVQIGLTAIGASGTQHTSSSFIVPPFGLYSVSGTGLYRWMEFK